jgi:hypothetical protein
MFEILYVNDASFIYILFFGEGDLDCFLSLDLHAERLLNPFMNLVVEFIKILPVILMAFSYTLSFRT